MHYLSTMCSFLMKSSYLGNEIKLKNVVEKQLREAYAIFWTALFDLAAFFANLAALPQEWVM